MNDLQKLVQEVLNEGKHNLKKEEMEILAEQLGKRLKNYAENTGSRLAEAKASCKNKVKENPLYCIGGAVAVGVVLGMLFRK